MPGLFYALIAGSLSDDHGRKPLIFFPVLGGAIEAVMTIIGYVYLKELPLTYWYFVEGYDLFGGKQLFRDEDFCSAQYLFSGHALFYLGIYSYGSAVTSMEKRAMRLSLYDGFEQVALLIGVTLSPTLLTATGYIGTHIIAILGGSIAMLYLIFILPGQYLKGK